MRQRRGRPCPGESGASSSPPELQLAASPAPRPSGLPGEPPLPSPGRKRRRGRAGGPRPPGGRARGASWERPRPPAHLLAEPGVRRSSIGPACFPRSCLSQLRRGARWAGPGRAPVGAQPARLSGHPRRKRGGSSRGGFRGGARRSEERDLQGGNGSFVQNTPWATEEGCSEVYLFTG